MASQANRGFMSNAGFVITDAGVVVYDSLATPALGRAMIAAISEVTDQPIRHVIAGHYHADHIYGLQAFKQIGATIWARDGGQGYLNSDRAQARLEQRREVLAPWVNADTHLIPADRWLKFEHGETIDWSPGGLRMEIIDVAGGHSGSDVMLHIPGEAVLFAGDLFATGRLPFVVDGDTGQWLAALEKMNASAPQYVLPGHGKLSTSVAEDIALTRDYIIFLRTRMGDAVDELMDFEQAYSSTDWSAFESLPAFEEANRLNAYSVFLEMQEASFQ